MKENAIESGRPLEQLSARQRASRQFRYFGLDSLGAQDIEVNSNTLSEARPFRITRYDE